LTDSILDFIPCNPLTGLGLGWVVSEHSLLQDLGLALGKVSDPQEGDRICRGQREEGNEKDPNQDREDALDLIVGVSEWPFVQQKSSVR
jgi:hypothetical protein